MKYAAAIFLFAATPALAAAPTITDTSFRAPDGSRVQQLELVVDAPVAKVWDAFATDAGFTSWAAPVAHVDLANDGIIEATYSLSGKIGDPDNIRNQIVAYVPYRMIAFHNVHVPKGAPFKPEVIGQIRTIVLFEDMGGRTRVTESGVGYRDGKDFDEMYAHFRSGNAEEFTALATYLTKGPVDWRAAAAAATASVGEKR
jgi:uncharacterized protein YndB with AHSA1/START domain